MQNRGTWVLSKQKPPAQVAGVLRACQPHLPPLPWLRTSEPPATSRGAHGRFPALLYEKFCYWKGLRACLLGSETVGKGDPYKTEQRLLRGTLPPGLRL